MAFLNRRNCLPFHDRFRIRFKLVSESVSPPFRASTIMASPDDAVFLGVERLLKPDGGCVYLLGTSHCSRASASHAAALVRAVAPSAVALELCESRRHMLSPNTSIVRSGAWEEEEHSVGNVVSSLSNLFADWTELIAMQYAGIERLAGTGTTANEFRSAAVEARSIGAGVVLADRDCALTQRRLKLLVPTSELLGSLLWEDSIWCRDQVSLSQLLSPSFSLPAFLFLAPSSRLTQPRCLSASAPRPLLMLTGVQADGDSTTPPERE